MQYQLDEQSSDETLNQARIDALAAISASIAFEKKLEQQFLSEKNKCYQVYFVNHCIETAHVKKVEQIREERARREDARAIIRKIKFLRLKYQ